MNRQIFRLALLIDMTIVIVIVVGLTYFIDNRNDKLMESMEQYEQYIQNEYNMSVYQYRELINK